ncbi:MAG: hypothetical protein ABL898_05360 [Hyphomicrobiaceae bacterium]
MRPISALPAVAAVASTAVMLVALITMSPDTVLAAEANNPKAAVTNERLRGSKSDDAKTDTSASTDKDVPRQLPLPPRWHPPAPRSIIFDDYDQIAALDAIRIALVEVGDGATYVWHRRDGSFSGTAVPTQSFKNRDGHPCRHIIVTLQAASHTRTTEGIACRLASGRWQLEG